jgi:hypothetical protein
MTISQDYAAAGRLSAGCRTLDRTDRVAQGAVPVPSRGRPTDSGARSACGRLVAEALPE